MEDNFPSGEAASSDRPGSKEKRPFELPLNYRALLLKLYQVQASCCRLYFSMDQIVVLWNKFTLPILKDRGRHRQTVLDDHPKANRRMINLTADALQIRIELLMSLFR